MGLIARHWEPDGLDALSPGARLALSVVVTGVAGFLLEYIGINVAHAFTNPKSYTIYVVTGIWAFGLGPLLVALRKASMIVPMLIVGIVFGILVLFNQYHYIDWVFASGTFQDSGRLTHARIWEFREGAIFGLKNPILIAIVAGAIETVVVPVSVIAQKLLTARLKKPAAVTIEAERDLFSGSVAATQIMKP